MAQLQRVEAVQQPAYMAYRLHVAEHGRRQVYVVAPDAAGGAASRACLSMFSTYGHISGPILYNRTTLLVLAMS